MDKDLKKLVPYILLGLILIFAGYFAIVLPFIVVALVIFLSYLLIKNKFLASVVAFLGITYVSSIFFLIIFYSQSSPTITQIEAAMTVISWGSIATYFDLFINLWIETQGIGLQWVFFSFGTVGLAILVVGMLSSDND